MAAAFTSASSSAAVRNNGKNDATSRRVGRQNGVRSGQARARHDVSIQQLCVLTAEFVGLIYWPVALSL